MNIKSQTVPTLFIATFLVGQVLGLPIVEDGFTVTQICSNLGRTWSAPGPGSDAFPHYLYMNFIKDGVIKSSDRTCLLQEFANLQEPIDSGHGPYWLTFDVVGNYGGDLFVNDDPPGGAGVGFTAWIHLVNLLFLQPLRLAIGTTIR